MWTILLDMIFLSLGIAIVLWGADRFTDGASDIARRWNVSELVIGLTIVAMGTSMPEFAVSFFSALDGSADMSVGNVVGSNIFNILVIVGVASLFIPMSLTGKLLARDIAFVVCTSLLLVALSYDGGISRREAFVLLLLFCAYMGYSCYDSLHDAGTAAPSVAVYGPWKTALFILLGIACLAGGGQMLVSGASSLAMTCGISERVVGLTILAAGTSLPELATSIVAARKGSKGLALGNVIGSNLFNILFVLGANALICPLRTDGIGMLDWGVLVGSSVLLLFFGSTDRRISRTEGMLLLLFYIVYMVALVTGWQFGIS